MQRVFKSMFGLYVNQYLVRVLCSVCLCQCLVCVYFDMYVCVSVWLVCSVPCMFVSVFGLCVVCHVCLCQCLVCV